jgi:hypothetical protein
LTVELMRRCRARNPGLDSASAALKVENDMAPRFTGLLTGPGRASTHAP